MWGRIANFTEQLDANFETVDGSSNSATSASGALPVDDDDQDGWGDDDDLNDDDLDFDDDDDDDDDEPLKNGVNNSDKNGGVNPSRGEQQKEETTAQENGSNVGEI